MTQYDFWTAARPVRGCAGPSLRGLRHLARKQGLNRSDHAQALAQCLTGRAQRYRRPRRQLRQRLLRPDSSERDQVDIAQAGSAYPGTPTLGPRGPRGVFGWLRRRTAPPSDAAAQPGTTAGIRGCCAGYLVGSAEGRSIRPARECFDHREAHFRLDPPGSAGCRDLSTARPRTSRCCFTGSCRALKHGSARRSLQYAKLQ